MFISNIDSIWGLSSHTEIALEANPNDANAAKWKDYNSAGINRISLGVQSFNNTALKLLGRDHNSEQAVRALSEATDTFQSVSADLIFGWAGQTKTDLTSDLDTLLQLNLNHISTYQLTIEDNTAFAKAEARGLSRAVNEDQSADFFEMILQNFADNGFDHYEISNFAKPHHQSEHNLAYWRGYDYVGVGPGAHGRITQEGQRSATICEATPEGYIKRVMDTGVGIKEREDLSPEDWAEEYLLMGLRINEGISLTRFKNIRGEVLSERRYAPLLEGGFLKLEKDRLIATQKGRFVLNAVTEALLV